MTTNIERSTVITRDIFWTCILRRLKIQNKIQNQLIVVRPFSTFEKKTWPDVTYDYFEWTDQQLIVLVSDLFLPAFIANAVQLQFILQRFYLQPNILKKCQDQISKVVGNSRLPSLNDRVKWVEFNSDYTNYVNFWIQFSLPYVEATIRESLRHETLVPSGLPHTATADTTFMGYNIPKVWTCSLEIRKILMLFCIYY